MISSYEVLFSKAWCFSTASAAACCWRPEATSLEVQQRCWPPNMLGVAFLLCCLSVQHAATVGYRETSGEDLKQGFGPLQSAYNAKDAGLLLQIAAALPAVYGRLSATRKLAFQLLHGGHAEWELYPDAAGHYSPRNLLRS